MEQSPFLAMQKTEAHIAGTLRALDTDLLSADEKKAAASLRRFVREARLDIRDYELSETRAEQLTKRQQAIARIQSVRSVLLSLSSSLSPADVAQLDAQLDHIKSRVN